LDDFGTGEFKGWDGLGGLALFQKGSAEDAGGWHTVAHYLKGGVSGIRNRNFGIWDCQSLPRSHSSIFDLDNLN
jgi:hypothetical protein